MFLFNEEEYVSEAIESILSQTYDNFWLIILDDCSTDNTVNIVQQFASKDKRITFLRNNEKKGYLINYQITFSNADDNAEYFAWAAGHDIHQPQWLEKMVKTLDKNRDTVMAYSKSKRIDEQGDEIKIKCPMFDTSGMHVTDRIKSICFTGTGFGNMIYGLFRTEAVRKVRGIRRCLVPDVLILMKLSLHGAFRQVDETLWYRRFAPKGSQVNTIERQKRVAFGTIPYYGDLPWALTHLISIFWDTVISPKAGSFSNRFYGIVLMYAFTRSRWRQMLPGASL